MKQIWYSETEDKRSPDTIHQILGFGTLEDIRSLKSTIGQKEIKELFLRYPKKIYTLETLNFIKNFILNIKDSIDEAKYLKFTPRRTRQ